MNQRLASRFLAKAKINGENYFQQRKVYQWERLKQKRFLSEANRPEMRLFQLYGMTLQICIAKFLYSQGDDLSKNLGKTTAQ